MYVVLNVASLGVGVLSVEWSVQRQVSSLGAVVG